MTEWLWNVQETSLKLTSLMHKVVILAFESYQALQAQVFRLTPSVFGRGKCTGGSAAS
jgi:hypothetical protein